MWLGAEFQWAKLHSRSLRELLFGQKSPSAVQMKGASKGQLWILDYSAGHLKSKREQRIARPCTMHSILGPMQGRKPMSADRSR